MKAERRHELQQNELADWLSGVIEQAKPHAGAIVAVVMAALLALVAWVYFSGTSANRGGPGWDAFYRALDIEAVDQRVKELNRVADENPGTPAGLWAQLMAADARLLDGTNKSYKNRLEGEDEIAKAIDGFEKVGAGAAKLSAAEGDMLRARALWGLAEAHEALAEVDPAIEQYEKLAKQFPETALGKEAAVRAKKLKGLEDWYEWYASVDPTQIKPTQRDRQPPLDFTPPRQPQPYDDLPDDPDLSLPGPLDLGPPSGGLLIDPPTGETPADPTEGSNTPEDSGDEPTEPESTEPESTEPSDSSDTPSAEEGEDAAPSDEPAAPADAPADGEEKPAGEGQ